MSSTAEELEMLIDDYVDGRLDIGKKAEFEERLKADPDLRRRVQTATQSIELMRSMLERVDPSEQFEHRVSNTITSITQSNPGLRPAKRGEARTKLTKDDADARLIIDPLANQEKKRLMAIAAVAAVLFAGAAAVIVLFLLGAFG